MYDLYKSVMINHVSKKHVCAAALFLCLCADIFSQSKNNEFYLQNVPSAYIGTYIPVQYDNILKKTRSHYAALFSNDGDYHDILYVQKHICYSDLRFHDGYAITAEEFNTYSFITKKSGMYIIDGNGNSYKKIGAEHDYIDVCRYVVSLIFEDALQLKNVELTPNASIIINGIESDPVLDPVFFETDGVALWLRSEQRGLAALKRKEQLSKANSEVSKVEAKIAKAKADLAKEQSKFDMKKAKGTLSPQDEAKFKGKLLKKQQKINSLGLDLIKAKERVNKYSM